MALIEKDVIVTTKYGQMPSFAVCPDQPGNFPGIIFYMDAPGIREELRNMCRRIAKMGYFVLLPDLFYRLGTIRLDVPRRDDHMANVFRAAMNSLTNQMVSLDDTGGMIQWLDGQDKCAPGPIGCVGHCMSGRLITTAAAMYPTRMAAAASLYGVGIVTDKEDSPHLLLDRVKGELYYAFAETDQTVPDNVIPDLKAAIKKTGTRATVEVFKGTHHGFAFGERAVYHPVAAEETWDKIFALWDRNVKRPG
jgi:carboxymethylenebutenolidase